MVCFGSFYKIILQNHLIISLLLITIKIEIPPNVVIVIVVAFDEIGRAAFEILTSALESSQKPIEFVAVGLTVEVACAVLP